MAIRYLPPRTTNRTSRLALLMQLWDMPVTRAQQDELACRAAVTQQRSRFGNLNHQGTPYPSESCLITRFHPSFESVIEPGVRPLVAAIAIDLDLVTYTSCEGHHYAGTVQPPDERHVGIIPRSPEEERRVLALFERAAARSNARHPAAAAEAALMHHTVVDGDVAYPAVDLYICKPAGASWVAYFADLDRVSDSLTVALLGSPDVAQRS
jgi:hypothetical protein